MAIHVATQRRRLQLVEQASEVRLDKLRSWSMRFTVIGDEVEIEPLDVGHLGNRSQVAVQEDAIAIAALLVETRERSSRRRAIVLHKLCDRRLFEQDAPHVVHIRVVGVPLEDDRRVEALDECRLHLHKRVHVRVDVEAAQSELVRIVEVGLEPVVVVVAKLSFFHLSIFNSFILNIHSILCSMKIQKYVPVGTKCVPTSTNIF